MIEDTLKNKKNNNNNKESIVEKINLNDIIIGEKLCKCNYGFIAYCKKIQSNKIYSLKILKKENLLSEKYVERQYNEYKNLSQIYHPFIIELRGINHIDPYHLYYMYELVPGESIKYLIKANTKLPLETVKFYSASIITALDYLHKKNIIERDLRPENIFLNSDGYIKLSEFTFSKKLKNDSDYSYSICGIPEYYSPEMINRTGYNKCIDFWQLGILIYEMITGYPPFIENNPVKLYKLINKGKINFPKGFNKSAKKIIKLFLKTDKNKRLGCSSKGIYDIIQQSFFKEFDWEGLLNRQLKPPFIPKIRKICVNSNNNNLFEENNEFVPKENDPFYNWD